ncbi:MAG: class I SAM-dependent methyltransferase [Patescibacteria group bacterium]|nr:class I SAM-dependent methyltransferase [Patescibacteria group bacterium]
MAYKIETQRKFISKNPIVKYANERFLSAIVELIKETKVKKLLDCGCGEGVVLHSIAQNLKNVEITGFDFDKNSVKLARKNVPRAKIIEGSIYKIPYQENFTSLALCTEVLEHLDNPQKALAEIKKVTSHYAIISVPCEPFFRMANVLRLAYLSSLGNTPGHINNWTSVSFKNLLSKYFQVEKVAYPFPWMVFLVSKRLSSKT